MVEGGMKCVKYLLFAFNFLFFLAGIGVIVVGSIVETKFREDYDFFGTKFNAVSIFLIVVGSIIFLLGFFGCCGAWKENYCMTMTFAVLLLLIFVLEIAGGIAGFVFRKQIEDEAKDAMLKTMGNYENSKSKVVRTWDVAQGDFKCCGVDNYTDWTVHSPNKTIPQSCCKEHPCDTTDDTKLYQKGCLNSFIDWAKSKILIIGGAGIGLAFVQILGVILACCLARTIKKEYEVV